MVDNPVQCPVCTLYLHAGMNLSDHLETHPKEQVIKALVEITIAGHSVPASVTTPDSDVASVDTKPNIDVKDHFLDGELDQNSNSSSVSTLASTTSTLSNFERAFMGCTSSPFPLSKQPESGASVSGTSIISNGNSTAKENKSVFNHQGPAKASASTDTKLFIEPTATPTDFRHFNGGRYHQQPAHAQQPKGAQQTKPSSQLAKQTSSSASMVPQLFGAGHHQHRGGLPLPSANPPTLTTQQVSQLASPPSPSGVRRPQMMQEYGTEHGVKHVFPSTLPPPPPLQLFSYSASQQLQHQKPPPPAYGTAISQIRSQQNSSKQHAASHTAKPHPPHHNHNFISQQQHPHHSRVDHPASSSTKMVAQQARKIPELPPPPPPVPLSTSPAKPEFVAALENLHFSNYVPDAPVTSHSSSTSSSGGAAHSKTQSQEQSQRHSVATVTPNSIPPALASFAAAAANSTSGTANPSSSNSLPSASPTVLRYAESPVAHYLERDNGDFILQETPKHIVECVETDDGEFSVIERIYQSPPSVLHIHDDANDDDPDEDIKEEVMDGEEGDMKNHVDVKGDNSDREKDQGSAICTSGKKKREDVASRKHTRDHTDRQAASPTTELPTSSSRINNDATPTPPNSNHSTPSSKSSNSSLSSNSSSNSSCSSSSGSGSSSTRKKSSKNSITVLSDVQLNLNEYLDLVGNIIASSNKKTYTAAAPIPLVKVEKIEVDEDDYAMQVERSSTPTYPRNEASNSSASEAAIPPPPPTPTKANNDETDELVENKVKILENPMPDDNSGKKRDETAASTVTNSSCTTTTTTGGQQACSSNVTSVIRMATITQLQQSPSRSQANQTPVETDKLTERPKVVVKDENEAQDLSQPQLKLEPKPQVGGLLRRGPKKLIIKPKATPTSTVVTTSASTSTPSNSRASPSADEQPTTSAVAQQRLIEREALIAAMPPKVTIKSEPVPESFGIIINDCRTSTILEQQLNQSGHRKHPTESIEHKQAEAGTETATTSSHCSRSESMPTILKEIKQEKTDTKYAMIQNKKAAEDAHVLLEFANSKKHLPAGESANFLSSSSIFSSAKSGGGPSAIGGPASAVNDAEEEFITSNDLNDNVVQEIVISSSYSSQSASDVNLTSGTNSNVLTVQQPSASGHQQQQFTDYPFSFLYGGEQSTATKGSFSSVYQNGHDTTAATHASSSSNFEGGDDSNSTHDSSSQPQNRFSGSQGAAPSQWWYSQQAAFAISSDFEVGSMAVECNNVMPEDVEVSKYLDLDTCKREPTGSNGIQVVIAHSPTSTSSFITATTDSDGCYTNDALNIRADEKMPAKGEISEQESNCDIENSWSQPTLSESAQRFFKTSFPGSFQQENGWPQDDWAGKSFDLRLPMEASTSGAVMGSNSTGDMKIYSQQQSDAIPSTSKSKKRRKRNESDAPGRSREGRSEPTATVTSQQMLLLQQQIQHHHHPMHPASLHSHQQGPTFLTPSSSTAAASLMAGPSTAAAAASLALASASAASSSSASTSTEQKHRKKVYQCAHCAAEFAKLKDRNSHLIKDHNYVRQNRKLISATAISATISTTTILAADTTPASCYEALVATSSVAVTNVNEMGNEPTLIYEDSKHSIVKMEMDASEPQQMPQYGILEGVETKSEYVDQKDNLRVSLEPLKTDTDMYGPGEELERKPTHLTQPLALTTPATKLAALYRMLVSFNISTLKQNRNLSELEEKLIENSIFFCYVCRCNFTSVKQYDLHLTEHPAECFTCGKKFQRWKNFSLHLKRHIGWKEFGCNVCDKKFVVRSALVEHMRMHTGQTPLKCKICGKYFKRYSNLTQHRKRHTRQYIRKKEYVCHCGEVLPSKARFLWHKETHDAKPKCCPYCCDRFVHANSLRRHIRLAHSDKFDYTEPMECPMCKQIFAKSSIKAHMATHSMDTQHDCPICNKTFSTKWNLKIHSWVHANRTAKPFKCEHCPKAFVREVDFKNHLNAHRQIKPYTCEYCGCKFIRKYNYMRHRREHHGNKKFTCDICNKSFHRHYYLIEHRRIHTGERPFQCNICGKSSTTKTNHNKHLKIHHSRDPFTVEA